MILLLALGIAVGALGLLAEWSAQHHPDIRAARDAFDAQAEAMT